MSKSIRQTTIAMVSVALLAAPAVAQWQEWGGPQRDFDVGRARLAESWPDAGPARLWTRNLGPGYTSILVDGGRLYTMYRKGDQEVVVALAAESGDTLWEYAYDAPVDKTDQSLDTQYGTGPNATPIVVANNLITFGFTGVLNCIDARDGTLLWSHDLRTEMGVEIPYFGHSASPIRHGDTVIVIANGALAFKITDGSRVWQNHEFDGSYASPLIVRVGDRQVLAAAVEGEIVGVDPDDGSLLWRVEHANQYKTILSSPVWGEDDVLFVSAMWVGSRALLLRADDEGVQADELWHSKDMQISHSNAIRVGDWIYGSHGERMQFLAAASVKTGEVAWKERGFARTNLIHLGGNRFVLLDFDAKLALATLTEEGAEIHAETQIFNTDTWTPPTLVGTTLYVRNQNSIAAFDLATHAADGRVSSRE